MINIRDSHQYLIGLFKFEGADAGHKLLAICMYIQTYGHLILKGFNFLKYHNFFIQ